MLRLKDIKKDYKVADYKVHALKGINLSFRENEFVSVLGPSGCGKTTLLNLIGGLDQYTSGDLYINGRSTKEFKDRDWDVYRNHRVGFIFQSYNLIPHQTVLGNVELALTIAGLSKTERTNRARLALDKVGLAGEYNKRPNQLSGGQSQRVAIARALVNDPDILLADEPTGALDTVTSVQIMDLIKEIAREKLVIMVTHNPDLAEKYSNRIIRLLDGELISDTNPYSEEDEKAEVKAASSQETAVTQTAPKQKEKAKMSFLTAFRLSLHNLFSKKARTIMTSIAGSIGIIGVSLVLAISYGVQSYIANMQNDMLSGNPIQISETAYDLSSMMQGLGPDDTLKALKAGGYVNVNSMVDYLVKQSAAADSMRIKNNITQEYIDYVVDMPENYLASIHLDYGLDVTNNIYTGFRSEKDGAEQVMSLSTIRTIYTSVLKQTQFKEYSSYITSISNIFSQVPTDEAYIMSQYNVLTEDFTFAKEKNEIMIVVNKDRELTDLLLAQLGYYSQEEFLNIVYRSIGDDVEEKKLYNEDPAYNKIQFSYDELIGKTFTWYPNDTLYNATGAPALANNPFTYNAYYDESFTDGVELKIVGILEPKDDISYGSLSSGFYYTEALAKYMIQESQNSALAQYLKNSGQASYNGVVMESKDGQITTVSGITFKYSYSYNGTKYNNVTGVVGSINSMSALISGFTQSNQDGYTIYTLSMQQLGGIDMANRISIYPTDFEQKGSVLAYLDRWNSDEDIEVNGVTFSASDRDKIKYTDNLSIIINLINNMIDVITYALVGFTALSLVVSCVMIAIITYVSVVERTKEIGVIRSLGGRKRDVSYLFNAETFIIGLVSGLIGIAVTYILSLLLNLVFNALTGMGSIAIFPLHYALIMVSISVLLTLVSGLLPSRAAAKKDPVVALRTE